MSEKKVKQRLQAEAEASNQNQVSESRSYKLIITVILFILIIAGSFIFYSTYHKKAVVAKTNSLPTFQYTNFNINFPGKPDITKSSTTIYKKFVPYTSYFYTDSNSGTYAVRSYNMATAIPFKYYDQTEINSFITTWINTNVSSASGWKLLTTEQTTLAGLPATYNTMSYSNGGSIENAYYYTVIDKKTETMFNIFTLNVPKNQADSFINSFSLS